MFPRYLRLSAFHVFLSLLNSLSCIGVFFVMYWCTSCVWLQLLPFIDNRHLESIPCLRRFTLLNINYIKKKSLVILLLLHCYVRFLVLFFSFDFLMTYCSTVHPRLIHVCVIQAQPSYVAETLSALVNGQE